MSKINVLENSLINKIAAGEVVERPVSIVKELVENAIDAGATEVSIEIKDGGISLIKISDNGCGIARDEVKTAFLRHATSKITSLADLENVLSLGFRGEALSSIASISQIELTTKTAADTTGIRLTLEGGVITGESETGMTNGTVFIIENVFFNTPARRKFLKKPSVESGYISDLVNRFAIGRPDISFTYVNNGSVIFKTTGQKNGKDGLKTALLQVYGKETMKNVIELSLTKQNTSLTGFVGKPAISRGNRAYEHFFVNGRYVKSEIVQSAAESAYKTMLMQGKFPFFVIKMEIKPYLVDVNVHPAKLEVRFAHEEEIYAYVYEAVSAALKSDSLIPEVSLKPKSVFTPAPAEPIFIPAVKKPSVSSIIYNTKESAPLNEEYEQALNHPERENPASASKAVLPWENEKPLRSYKIAGQIFNTYWLLEVSESLYVVDQHAAHERILYEEIMAKAMSAKVASQQMLQPVVLKLTPSEAGVLNENMDLFERFGFGVEQFGEEAYAIRSVPYIVKGEPNTDFFIEILDGLSNIQTAAADVSGAKTEIIASKACKAAVKANDKLSYAEAKALIDKLMALENPYTCPHGRPTIVEITKYEIEKKFKRV